LGIHKNFPRPFTRAWPNWFWGPPPPAPRGWSMAAHVTSVCASWQPSHQPPTRASERILGVPHPSTAKRPPRLEDGKCELLCSLHWLCSASCASRRIIDGDTLAIGSTKIRLEGIDAPETDQFCLNVGGVRWTCGIAGSSRAGGSPRRSTDQLQSQAVSTPTSERSPPASSRASSGWVLLGWRRKRKAAVAG